MTPNHSPRIDPIGADGEYATKLLEADSNSSYDNLGSIRGALVMSADFDGPDPKNSYGLPIPHSRLESLYADSTT